MSPDELESLIHRRASGMTIDRERPVDDDVVSRIVRSGIAAPNHRKTRPLRVAVLRGDARLRFGDAVADVMASRGEEDHKVDKTRTKYGRAPVVLVVAAAEGATTLETDENRYTVAAGIQNMLLMLESFGFTALWSTPATGANAAMCEFCSFDPTDHVMGVVYFGWPTREAPVRDRPEPVVSWLD
ncbi:MAG: nitroreductase family protein [Ilumatobacteraceae bacterium]